MQFTNHKLYSNGIKGCLCTYTYKILFSYEKCTTSFIFFYLYLLFFLWLTTDLNISPPPPPACPSPCPPPTPCTDTSRTSNTAACLYCVMCGIFDVRILKTEHLCDVCWNCVFLLCFRSNKESFQPCCLIFLTYYTLHETGWGPTEMLSECLSYIGCC